jgi:hypothetical protein
VQKENLNGVVGIEQHGRMLKTGGIDLRAREIGNEGVAREPSRDVVALQVIPEEAEIGTHQIVGLAVDRRRESAVAMAAAVDLRLIISREQGFGAAAVSGQKR